MGLGIFNTKMGEVEDDVTEIFGLSCDRSGVKLGLSRDSF